MTYDFAVVGANGIQGKIVARDLLESGYAVLLCALDDFGLEKTRRHPKAGFAISDIREGKRLRQTILESQAKVLVNCALDDFNLELMQIALDLGLHYLDLGSDVTMYREQQKLHADFVKKDRLAISGLGSTPGISNVMLRYVAPQFDTIETVHLGFSWNSNLPAFVPPFSIDAIAYEFSEPATIFRNGRFIDVSPEEPTGIHYDYLSIGRQTTCYTKHIEHHTFVDFLKDKGIQNVVVYSSFPEHSYKTIRQLLELGFLSKDPVVVDGVKIRPLDYTIEMLRRLPVPSGYTEKENIWVKVYGQKDGAPLVAELDCLAETQPGWEEATCNIDTGFPASIVAQMILNGVISERGFFSPECVVPPAPFFAELAKRQIFVHYQGKRLIAPDAGP